MRSAKRVMAVCLLTLPAAAMLGGCVSTQRIAARARLVDARIRVSQNATEVPRQSPAVRVAATELIRTAAGTTVVVRLINRSTQTLSDLPIAIGVRAGDGRPRYLNDSAGLDYFETHIAALGGRDETTWVLTTARRVAPRLRAFAVVGSPSLAQSAAPTLPRIDAGATRGLADRSGGWLALSLHNRSAIPQYDLQVYAVATRAGHDVAAGRAAVSHLGSFAATRVRLQLVGSPRDVAVQVLAVPTILN